MQLFLSGLLYDISGSYDHTFYLGGIFIGVSGMAMCLVPIYKYISIARHRRNEPNTDDDVHDVHLTKHRVIWAKPADETEEGNADKLIKEPTVSNGNGVQ